MDRSSRNRLTDRQIPLFPGETLFDRLGRCVCRAGCLPRKELYEAWEVARRVRRHFRGGRVIDLACGHGLLAYILLLLDDSSSVALAVDRHMPQQAAKLAACLEEDWPRLAGRVEFVEKDLRQIDLFSGDLVVSVHACGGLTDLVLERTMAAGARVGVLPCCHDLDEGAMGGLQGWLDGPLSQDVLRATRLREMGYRVITKMIPRDITPKNRLLLGEPITLRSR